MNYNPVSIDAFLRDNYSHRVAGKIMIIYSLLKCEITSLLHDDNWYSYLFNDISSGCNKPEDILENKLTILTFNYDVSLDYYLYNSLINTESLQKNNTAYDYINALKNNYIKHLYGQVYDNENILKNYGTLHMRFENIQTNMRRFVTAVQNKNNIKLINDERNSISSSCDIQKIIQQSNEIIIIGFSFDRDNLDILGFPYELSKYRKFLSGKELKYMDYKGQMNSLYNQFNEIQKQHKNILIIRSPADLIINAYQNDFKIYLYK